jgi:hypothetical protein
VLQHPPLPDQTTRNGGGSIMAIRQSETATSAPQALDGFPDQAFRRFSTAVLLCAQLTGDQSDGEVNAALEEATDAGANWRGFSWIKRLMLSVSLKGGPLFGRSR